MDIIINDRQLVLLESCVSSIMKEKIKCVDTEKQELENYIEANGDYMTDITNGKTYLVQYLDALSKLVGKPYAVCAPVKGDGTYGAFYVKPYDTFQKKVNYTTNNKNISNPMKRKPNLYQQLGLNQ